MNDPSCSGLMEIKAEIQALSARLDAVPPSGRADPDDVMKIAELSAALSVGLLAEVRGGRRAVAVAVTHLETAMLWLGYARQLEVMLAPCKHDAPPAAPPAQPAQESLAL